MLIFSFCSFSAYKLRRAAVLGLRHSELRARVRANDVTLRIMPQSCSALRTPWDSEWKEAKRRVRSNEAVTLEPTPEAATEESGLSRRSLPSPLDVGMCGDIDILFGAGASLWGPTNQTVQTSDNRPSLNRPSAANPSDTRECTIQEPSSMGSTCSSKARLSEDLFDSREIFPFGDDKSRSQSQISNISIGFQENLQIIEVAKKTKEMPEELLIDLDYSEKEAIENSDTSDSDDEDSQRDLMHFTSSKGKTIDGVTSTDTTAGGATSATFTTTTGDLKTDQAFGSC